MTRDGQAWYDVNIVVRKDRLMSTINELRAIGGSGVVVTPVTYIFEEEPPRYTKLLQVLADS
jgi:ATP phosphoribosyltransferase